MNNKEVEKRAKIISENNNNLEKCLATKALPSNVDVSLSEGLILALLKPVSYTHLTLPTICSV